MSDERAKAWDAALDRWGAVLERALDDRDAANLRADAAEARVRELHAAARALLDALPRCEAPGCAGLAFRSAEMIYVGSGDRPTVGCGQEWRCPLHHMDREPVPWAEPAEALRRLLP